MSFNNYDGNNEAKIFGYNPLYLGMILFVGRINN